MKKSVLALLIVPCALVCFLWAAGGSQAQESGAITLYTGENFTGRTVTLRGSAFDLPTEEDPDGSVFGWNDEVRSVIVSSGTWRLYQNGRCNTRLDDTEIELLDVRTKDPVSGWSTLVSATSIGALEIPNLASAGVGSGVSSIELVSSDILPDWAQAMRGRALE